MVRKQSPQQGVGLPMLELALTYYLSWLSEVATDQDLSSKERPTTVRGSDYEASHDREAAGRFIS